jgi:NADH-quinone oxidoreductase subunit C
MASPAPAYASNDGVIDAIRAALGPALIDAIEAVGEIKLTVDRQSLVGTMARCATIAITSS